MMVKDDGRVCPQVLFYYILISFISKVERVVKNGFKYTLLYGTLIYLWFPSHSLRLGNFNFPVPTFSFTPSHKFLSSVFGPVSSHYLL